MTAALSLALMRSARSPSTRGVRMAPGQTAFTVMPWGPNSCASCRVIDWIAPFDAT